MAKISGSITVAADTAQLSSSAALYAGLRLDYPGTALSPLDSSVSALRSEAIDADSAATPQLHSRLRGDGSVDDYRAPLTGNGFTGAQNDIIPEYRARGARLLEGAEMWEVMDDGSQRLHALLRNRQWIPQGN